jgi:hypothetical protein
VLSEHGIDIAPPPVCPMARNVVLDVVGAVVAAELELPLVLRDGESDGAHRCALEEVALLDVFIEQRPLQQNGGDGVPVG